MEIRIK